MTNAHPTDSTWTLGQVVRVPRSELVKVADAIDVTIHQYLLVRRQVSSLGQWEAPREAWALNNLMIRNIEAALVMARTDEVLVTAAWSNARCAFEQAVRTIWLLYPADRFSSECRWLGLLADQERFHRLIAEAAENDPAGSSGELHRERSRVIRQFREGVTAKLPPGYQPEKTPSLEKMLQSTNGQNMYRYYREGSQYVHGSMWGTSSYRRNLGSSAEHGEFTDTSDWILPLRLCWLSLQNAGVIILDRLSDEPHKLDWRSTAETIDRSFDALARTVEG